MGMTSGGGGKKVISEINVTPLVDVMLVLLVIFMVAAPMMQPDDSERVLDMDLPVTQESDHLVAFDPTERLMLQIDDQLGIFVGAEQIVDCSAALTNPGPQTYEPCFEELQSRLELNPRLNDDERLFLLADADIPYGFVVGAMNRIRLAGVTNVGMVTNREYLTDEQRSQVATE